MGKRTRLPVGLLADREEHGQASTIAHGTGLATSGNEPILESVLTGREPQQGPEPSQPPHLLQATDALGSVEDDLVASEDSASVAEDAGESPSQLWPGSTAANPRGQQYPPAATPPSATSEIALNDSEFAYADGPAAFAEERQQSTGQPDAMSEDGRPAQAAVRETPSNSNGSTTSAGQDSTGLLQQANQQLEQIRQTLEKILAKPGSVVMD